MVIQEAMACGLPVISTDKCAAALELIKHGENGYIIPFEDVCLLEEYIQVIISSENICAKVGARVLKIIKSFNYWKMVEGHLKYL